MLFKIILLTLCVAYTRSQATFGTLSSSAFRETTTQLSTSTTKVSFGTLSSSAFRTTTTSNTLIECSLEAKQICKNGAECVPITSGNFYCVCAPGFFGADCNSEASTLTTVTTTLPPTFTTVIPETTTTASLVKCPNGLSICRNDGECYIVNNSDIRCKCKAGFTGIFCETEIIVPETTPVPKLQCPSSLDFCENDGECYLIDDGFFVQATCECKPGFTGYFCETNVFSTTTGTTITTTTDATHHITTPTPTTITPTPTTTTPAIELCPSGIDICKNDGICFVINDNTIVCQCKAGFTGLSCETEIKPITTTPSVIACPAALNICKNNAECFIVNNEDMKCNCRNDFTGKFCEISVTETTIQTESTITTTTQTTTTTSWSACPLNVCSNGGTCGILNGKDIICTCAVGFTGGLCQFPLRN